MITGFVGVAGVGIQLFDVVQRVAAFIDNVRGAPEDIKYLLDEIQTLRLVLSDHFNRHYAIHGKESEAVEKCVKHCWDSAVHLEKVLAELNATVQKRKTIGSLKAVWKKGMVSKAEERLQKAQTMLLFATQSYME